MGGLNDVTKIIANEFIQSMFTKDCLKLSEINKIMHLLIRWNIPFELAFTEATRSEASSIILRVKLSPSTVIEHLINLESGAVEF